MEYQNTVRLRNGRTCVVRSCSREDAEAVLSIFEATHKETDFMLTYPGEEIPSIVEEQQYLKEMEKSSKAIELIALVDGEHVGTAGVSPVGTKEKLRHRAEMGIGILKAYWRYGYREDTDADLY